MSNADRPEVPVSAETYERRRVHPGSLRGCLAARRTAESHRLSAGHWTDRLPLLVELAHEELDHRIKAGESAAWRTTCAAIPTWRETPTRSSASSPPSGNWRATNEGNAGGVSPTLRGVPRKVAGAVVRLSRCGTAVASRQH